VFNYTLSGRSHLLVIPPLQYPVRSVLLVGLDKRISKDIPELTGIYYPGASPLRLENE